MSKKAVHVKVNEVTRIVTALFLLFSITFCTPKPKKTEQCFIRFDHIGPQDDFQPPIIISNFPLPDSLRSHRYNSTQVSPNEYERIQRIVKFKSNISSDTARDEEVFNDWRSIGVHENCNSKEFLIAEFKTPQAQKYLEFITRLMKEANTKKEIIDALKYF